MQGRLQGKKVGSREWGGKQAAEDRQEGAVEACTLERNARTGGCDVGREASSGGGQEGAGVGRGRSAAARVRRAVIVGNGVAQYGMYAEGQDRRPRGETVGRGARPIDQANTQLGG